MRGKESINKNLECGLFVCWTGNHNVKISVECKRNAFAHQYTGMCRLILKENNRPQTWKIYRKQEYYLLVN